MWEALTAAVDVITGSAEGTCDPEVYISCLDPGVGKTQLAIHAIRGLLASPEHEGVAAIVCVNRKSQIEDFIRAGGFTAETFAIFTADVELNGRGHPDPGQARLLLTTHQMVMSRCTRAGGSFEAVEKFHYLGQPRAVRIWDEAMLPGEPLMISRDRVAGLLQHLRAPFPKLAEELDRLVIDLMQAADGDQLVVPHPAGVHGIDIEEALKRLDGAEAKARDDVRTLWLLFGRSVTVRKDGVYGDTVLDYEETLPRDIGPVLVLDASARVRETYRLWKEKRGGLVTLPEAVKSYERLSIAVWNQSGGRSSIDKNREKITEAIASTINANPGERWLVVHHLKAFQRNFAHEIRRELVEPGNVSFLHWGAHDATNVFAYVPNVILAGTYFYRTSDYEAHGRLSAGLPSSAGPFPDHDRKAVQLGEHRHHVLQALCRSAVRRCEADGGCPSTKAYIIAKKASGIENMLSTVFPGCTIRPWHPVLNELRGRRAAAAAYLRRRLFEQGAALVTVSDLMQAVDIKDKSNFRRNVRSHPDFRAWLGDVGIVERDIDGDHKCFRRLADELFPPDAGPGEGQGREAGGTIL